MNNGHSPDFLVFTEIVAALDRSPEGKAESKVRYEDRANQSLADTAGAIKLLDLAPRARFSSLVIVDGDKEGTTIRDQGQRISQSLPEAAGVMQYAP